MNSNMFLAFFICLTALVGESLANQFTFETPLWTCPAPFIDSLKIQLDDIRYKYNVPFLTHSPEMDLEAQIWSSQLMVVNRAEENPNTPYGQTIFRGVAPGNQNKLTVDMELEILKMGQSEYYAYYMGEPMPYDIETTKNFAQTVWKATSKFGVGCSAGNLNGETVLFVVVYFDPKGLVKGQYRQNVHPKFDWIRFNAPMFGCPDDFQYNFIRRLNDDRSLYLDAKRVVINTTLRNIAQLESDRMSLLNQGLGTVQLSKQYGTLTFLKVNENYNWVDVYPRYPLYDWGAKTPEYLLDDGSVLSFSEEKWIKPMDIGLGCTTRRFGMKSILIMVALFWDSIDRRKLCPTPKPTITTTTTLPSTTVTPRPTTVTTEPTTVTTQPTTVTTEPTTVTTQPTTVTTEPTTVTTQPTTVTTEPTTVTTQPTTVTTEPTTVTTQPTTVTTEPTTVTTEPTTVTTEPTTVTTQPTTVTTEPTTVTTQPTTVTTEPTTVTTEPTTVTTEPTTVTTQPTTVTTEPTTVTTQPTTVTTEPTTVTTQPTTVTTEPTTVTTQPTTVTTEPTTVTTEPTTVTTEPTTVTTEPTTSTTTDDPLPTHETQTMPFITTTKVLKFPFFEYAVTTSEPIEF